MNTGVANFLEDVSALVSPPDVWLRINDLIHDPYSSASDIAEATSRDPSLTAKILKVVNSPYYNFPTRIDTVSRAITIMGADELFNTVTTITVTNVFSKIPNNLVRPEMFWRHSMCTAIAAKRLARTCNVLHPERLYTAGMLHDIGSLLLYRKFPEKAAVALMAAGGNEGVLSSVENDIFGFDHALVGAELLRRWNLPPSLVGAVKYHHQPDSSADGILDASIVHVADVIANRLACGAFSEEPTNTEMLPDPIVWKLTGMSPDVLGDMTAGLEEELTTAISVFLRRGTGAV